MKAPQIIVIVLFAMSVGIDLVRDGEPKTGSHSVWITIADAVLTLGLLKWGGFFG
jgi:hypothetical protein